jgi:hypothetical protein
MKTPSPKLEEYAGKYLTITPWHDAIVRGQGIKYSQIYCHSTYLRLHKLTPLPDE